MGLTFEEVLVKDGFIYTNFIKKNSEFPDLKSLVVKQEKNIKNACPSSEIEYKSNENIQCLCLNNDLFIK